MAVNKWHMSEALTSYRRLLAVVDKLSEEEVVACLELEAGSQRRHSVTERLIKRAISLYSQRLQEKYGSP